MKPDLKAIRRRCEAATPGPWQVCGSTYDEDCREHLAPFSLEDSDERLIWSSGGGEYAHPDMPTAQFIAHARTDIPALLACIETLDAECKHLRKRNVLLKRAHGALADAGCVAPGLDESIETAIKALAERATEAEAARDRAYDREAVAWADCKQMAARIEELQARIAVLEAMKP